VAEVVHADRLAAVSVQACGVTSRQSRRGSDAAVEAG
jgi:hypothetical protein